MLQSKASAAFCCLHAPFVIICCGKFIFSRRRGNALYGPGLNPIDKIVFSFSCLKVSGLSHLDGNRGQRDSRSHYFRILESSMNVERAAGQMFGAQLYNLLHVVSEENACSRCFHFNSKKYERWSINQPVKDQETVSLPTNWLCHPERNECHFHNRSQIVVVDWESFLQGYWLGTFHSSRRLKLHKLYAFNRHFVCFCTFFPFSNSPRP